LELSTKTAWAGFKTVKDGEEPSISKLFPLSFFLLGCKSDCKDCFRSQNKMYPLTKLCFEKNNFSSLIVEERVETLVYDVGSFLAAAGGNLGLFLGFSCLSVCLSLIKFLVNHFG
jgi:hypothetical protein